MKLIPTIKLIGSDTVSLTIRLTFFLCELFCMPTIKIQNKERLKVKIKNNFLRGENIFY